MNELRYQVDLLKAMNQKLSAKERMYQLVCNTTDCAFLHYSFEKNEITLLGKWKDFFDFEIQEIRELERFYDIVEEQDSLSLREALFPEKKGEEKSAAECLKKDSRNWFRFDVNVVFDDNGRPVDKIVTITDITRYKLQNEEITYFAYYDSITGLYNRNHFVTLLGEKLKKAAQNNNVVSVMMIDIDDFHNINDGFGMVIGDEIIQQFGFYLKGILGKNAMVCHMNRDVYCIAVYAPNNDCSVEYIYREIQKRTQKPFLLSNGQEILFTVSIGVAEYPEATANSALDLINCAEIVLYKCKELGKNSIQYYDDVTLNEFLQNVEIENKLKEAVAHNYFELYYQPQYYTGNKKLRGMEVLIRWNENDEQVSPALFIPIAEKNGIIISIGDLVVEESIRQYAKWRKEYGVQFVLSINISARQYQKDNFVESLLQVLDKYDVEPSDVELEVTESILIDDFDAFYEKLKVLKEHGIRISLDDFGTGFSSLSYLKKLPINTLKIDKSFIDTVLTDSTTRVITESIIDMVKALGYESIAEGVENDQQYQYLHVIGCDVIQGYLLGRPQPASEIDKLLNAM